MTWSLDSVVARHKEAPYTFYVPSEYVLNKIEIGELVKLIFLCGEEDTEYRGERMWVEIIHRSGDELIGTLRNEPVSIKDLVFGQEIHFKIEHICDTMHHDPSAVNWDYYFEKKVVVTNDVLERNEFNFMVRDFPNESSESDTGWSFFTGYEEENDPDDIDNYQFISIGKVLNIDDSILSFIDREPQCAFERNLETKEFYEVFDYEWEE